MPEFGEALLPEFMFDPGTVQLNNGSYGSVPRCVVKFQRALQDEVHGSPDGYFRLRSRPLWRESLRTVAGFLGAKPENMTFVDNATFGLNTALKSIKFEPGDALLASTWTYHHLQKCCNFLQDQGTEIIRLPFKVLIESKQEVIELYEEYLRKHPNIKVVLPDHVTSATAVLMPLKEVIDLCHRHGKIVVVDGAHGPGQLPLNLEELGADFYSGTLHKWLFSPRSCGVLYVHPKHHGTVHSPITSRGYGDGRSFQTEFMWQGTRDDTTCGASVEGIRFLKSLGGLEARTAYISKLLDNAVELLTTAWGTDKFPIPRDMEAPFMRMVRLPPMKMIDDHLASHNVQAYPSLDNVSDVIRDRFGLLIYALWIMDAPWVRLSAQVYNSLDHYQRLADAILTLKAEEADK